MSRLIYHVDDSTVALKMAAQTIRQVVPAAEIKQFTSGRALLDSLLKLESIDQYPWMIFCDIGMLGLSGLDVLNEIKRHAKFHALPVVLWTSDREEQTKIQATQSGAYGYLSKPVEMETLAQLIQKYDSQAIPLADLLPLDLSFADEMLDLCSEMQKISTNLHPDAIKEMYRLFHTVKGGANSIQFPHLGQFMHTAEAFLNAVRDGNLYALPQVKELLTATIAYVESQADQIKSQMLLEKPDPQVLQGLKLVKTNVDSGWKFQTPTPANSGAAAERSENNPSPNQEASEASGARGGEESTHSPILSRSASSVRIKNDSLDDLQKRFKRVLQLRVKLSTFANNLQNEFFDEQFPKDLLGIIEDLTRESTDIMDFFISLRVVPASRLKTFCARVITQTAEQLSKPANLAFDCEPTLEVDQSVLDCIEGCLTHILRNAIDHGLEKAEKRAESGKDPAGLISVSLRKENKESMLIEVKDDGGGINKESLKAAMLKKGVITAETLAKLEDDQVYDLIFVDGLSTKQEVSDVSGRGVGLGAVKESIIKLGGTIKVTSEMGVGTRFIINVPRIFKL